MSKKATVFKGPVHPIQGRHNTRILIFDSIKKQFLIPFNTKQKERKKHTKHTAYNISFL